MLKGPRCSMSNEMESSFESVLKLKNLAHLEKARRAGLTMSVRRVAFVLRENFSMMAFTGAVDALVTANLMSSAPLFEIRVVGGRDNLVVSDLGIAISTDCSFAELKEKEQDIIVGCGGGHTRRPLERKLLPRRGRAAGWL